MEDLGRQNDISYERLYVVVKGINIYCMKVKALMPTTYDM